MAELNDLIVNDRDVMAELDELNTNFIVEYNNSPENGYIKYSSGLMIQWVRLNVTDQAINSSYGSIYTGSRTWTYDVPFISTPTAFCGQFKWGTGGSWGIVGGATATQCVLYGFDYYSRATGTLTIITAMVIGKWK